MKHRIVNNGECASEKMCFPVYGKNSTKQKWVIGKKLVVAECEYQIRVFRMVFIGKRTLVYMDAITGTLYNKQGKCLSSDKLYLRNISRSDLAKGMLINWEPEFISGEYLEAA